METLILLLQILIPIGLFIVAGYTGYLNGRIRQLEKDVKNLEVQTALNTKDGKTFEKYFDEFKTDMKGELQEIKEILKGL